MVYQFTEEDKQSIKENPLSDAIKPFCEIISKDVSNFDDYVASAANNRESFILIFKLVNRLQEESAAEALFLPNQSSFQQMLFEFVATWLQQEQFPSILRPYCSFLLQR